MYALLYSSLTRLARCLKRPGGLPGVHRPKQEGIFQYKGNSGK